MKPILKNIFIVFSFLLSFSAYSQSEKENIQKNVVADSARLIVTFIVETTGEITNAKVEKIECESCSRRHKKDLKSEALRVVNSMEDWKPIEKRTKCRLPIKIILD